MIAEIDEADHECLRKTVGTIGFSHAKIAAHGVLLIKANDPPEDYSDLPFVTPDKIPLLEKERNSYLVVFDERWVPTPEFVPGLGLCRDLRPGERGVRLIHRWEVTPEMRSFERAWEVAKQYLIPRQGDMSWHEELIDVPTSLIEEISYRMYTV